MPIEEQNSSPELAWEGSVHLQSLRRIGGVVMGTSFQTTKKAGGWVVKKEGSTSATSLHSTQSDAWAETRRLARGAGGEALLKGADGRVRARNTYGKDPFPPKG
jgi:hypothetical protein